jgi:hypothetical protein
LGISVRACLFKAGLNPSLIALAARPLAALLGNFCYAEDVEQNRRGSPNWQRLLDIYRHSVRACGNL